MATTKQSVQDAVSAYFTAVDVKEAALTAKADADSTVTSAQASQQTATENLAAARADIEIKKAAVVDALSTLGDDDPQT